MKVKVVKKQYNSRMCFICGVHNDAGMHTHFYELENEYVLGIFKASDLHQSYPNRMHGGLIGALLDETVGRAIQIHDENTWGVTAEMTIRYLKPVPLNQDLKVIGYLTSKNRRMFTGEGYIFDEQQNILAECQAKYVALPVNKIVTSDFVKEEWVFIEDDEFPHPVELPK